ncbi:hypothetical protein K7432_009539, partial [Basidiobolus ranarum]
MPNPQNLPLPILDFQQFQTDPTNFVQPLKEALFTTGFFYLKNHDIPKEKIQKQFQRSKDFFQQDKSVKSETPISSNNAGYSAAGVEKLDPKLGVDLKEAFNFRLFPESERTRLPTIFAEHEEEIIGFYKACHNLCS